jgi:hypothetical protein
VTPRNVPSLSAVSFAALCCAAVLGCAAPQDSVAALGEIYDTRDPPRATYSSDAVDRGWGARFGQSFRLPWSEPEPLSEVEPLEDPVAFALEHLDRLDAALADGDEELDLIDRAIAVATLADLATLDRSRIVRQRAFAVMAFACGGLPTEPSRPKGASTEAGLPAALEPLLAYCEVPAGDVAPLTAVQASELTGSARQLEATAVEGLKTAQRLALLCAKGARRASRSKRGEQPPGAEAEAGAVPDAVRALERAAAAQARQAAWLATLPATDHPRGIGDPGDLVRATAGRVRLLLDPVAATEDLGRAWVAEQNRAFAPGIVTLVRIEWLKTLAEAPISGANVHPSLRGPLLQELDAEDASVAHWARAAIAHLLGRDPGAPRSELSAAWLALGEWQPARSGT